MPAPPPATCDLSTPAGRCHEVRRALQISPRMRGESLPMNDECAREHCRFTPSPIPARGPAFNGDKAQLTDIVARRAQQRARRNESQTHRAAKRRPNPTPPNTTGYRRLLAIRSLRGHPAFDHGDRRTSPSSSRVRHIL